MIKYILKRLVSAVPVLIIVALIVFFMTRLSGGDPARVLLGGDATDEQISAVRSEMGLDHPLYEQLLVWGGHLVQGNLGYSYVMQQSVTEAITSHFGPTIAIALLGQILALLVAIPLGVQAARRKGTWTDQGIMGFATLTTAFPSFLVGLLLIAFFAVTLKVLPASGWVEPTQNFAGFVSHLVLPAIAVTSLQIAVVTRMTRSSMVDVLTGDFIRTTRAKGLPERKIIWKHGLKNASIPVLTVVGQSFGALIAGTVVVETVFNIPGIGQLVANSILRRDYSVVQGVLMLTALAFIIINLVVDIFYAVIDPRIRERSF
ncbi:ABC transporter permease [Pseudoclavibacter sp. 13-3]|uniref:ABC transporter permease n=1 Tax=Pseudoclavibacter sp. 13-3 TaxID=2901228 RepID=UPI001E297799|nr:ABC transporter permease [Pseudoclavibacter sp. 13-3]MCD7101312.1 ABC transporter permease [Pseudoclavibacter sp. 13-3]